jgi:hypothetical protein
MELKEGSLFFVLFLFVSQMFFAQEVKVPRELWPHEAALVKEGLLCDITHSGSPHVIFEATSLGTKDKEQCVVYRHMGDVELRFLLEHNALPESQPYQTIVRGEEGIRYCKKYFGGGKRVGKHYVILFVCLLFVYFFCLFVFFSF